MAPPDDEIPDLFPAGAASKPSARARPAPQKPRRKAPDASRAAPTKKPPARPTREGSLMPAAKPRPKPPRAKPLQADRDAVRESRRRPDLNTGFELEATDDLPADRQQTLVAGTADELEFDPMSRRQPSLAPLAHDEQEFKDTSRGSGGELDLDLSPQVDASPAPNIHNAPEPVAASQPVTLSGAPPADSGDVGLLDLDGGTEASPGPAPSRSSAGQSASVSPSAPPGQQSVPALNVPSLAPQPVKPPAQPTPPQDLSAQTDSPGLDPLGGADLAAFSGMGNDVDLGGDLDDFGGAAAAQLNVGVPVAEQGDDLPWPTGVTPVGDGLAVSREEAQELSGFGPAPRGFFQTPMYALRVFTALRELRDKDLSAQKRLEELEQSRDERLAQLAESLRGELEGKDRFAALFAEVDKHDQNIAAKKLALETADVEGAQTLRDVQAQLDARHVERMDKQRFRDGKRAIFSESERTLRRYQAALKRIQIQWRNIEQQAQKYPGEEMPDELDAQLDVLEAQKETENKNLSLAKEQLGVAKKILKQAEDEVRLINAEIRRTEGQKEGLLMAYEGDIAQHSRELDQAVQLRQDELSSAGRAIIDLRGEVKVDLEVRKDLLAADAAVEAAARQKEMTTMALASMDSEAFSNGKAVWIGSVIALLVLLIWAAI